MEIRVVSRGETEFTADREYQEPALRTALASEAQDEPSVIARARAAKSGLSTGERDATGENGTGGCVVTAGTEAGGSAEPGGPLTRVLNGGFQPHVCSFPCNPPGGSILGPGPCECGKTYAQGRADELLAEAAAAAAAAYPLPDAPFLTGMSDDAWHAVRRADAERTARLCGKDPAVYAVCGKLTVLALAWPVYGETHPRSVPACPECAWTAAAERGDLDAQVEALAPSTADYTVLARLLPDPLIAVTAAAMLAEAAVSGHGDYEPDHPALIQLLAAITRHAPVILVSEDCAEGSCGHCPDGCNPGSGQPRECSLPDAAVACAGCSLQAGEWAGEWEGQFRSEATIPAPCAVLTALAGHAAKALEGARRGQQALADWEAEKAADTAAADTPASRSAGPREAGI